MKQQMATAALRRWIVEQSEAGCRPQDVLASMHASGWQADVALAALEDTLRQRHVGPGTDAHLPAATAVPWPDLADASNALWVGDRQVQVLLALRSPRLLVLGGFLDDDECDELIRLAQPRLQRSETVVYANGASEVHQARTSRGMFFSRGETPLCARLEQRIAALLRWPVVNGEGLQVLHYGAGAEYKPHYDFFDPAQPGMASVLARGGQRVATVLMYLATPTRGGATVFPDVGLSVAAVRGHALFFSYDRPHAVTRTLHGGAPVLEGEKWVATQWLREREFV